MLVGSLNYSITKVNLSKNHQNRRNRCVWRSQKIKPFIIWKLFFAIFRKLRYRGPGVTFCSESKYKLKFSVVETCTFFALIIIALISICYFLPSDWIGLIDQSREQLSIFVLISYFGNQKCFWTEWGSWSKSLRLLKSYCRYFLLSCGNTVMTETYRI